MKTLNKAAKAILKNEKNEILILLRTPLYKRKGIQNVTKKYYHLDSENIWDLPGGRLFLNEDFKSALKREVKEELGLNIVILKKMGFWSFISLDNKKINVLNFFCRFSKKSKSNKIILSSEHVDYKWISLKNIKKYKFKDKSIFNALNI